MTAQNKYIAYGVIALLLVALGALLGALGYSYINPCRELPNYGKPDEVIVRDTIKVPVPVPVSDGVVDKVVVPPRKDSDTVQNDERTPDGTNVPKEDKKPVDDTPSVLPSGEVEIPIERKTYQTEDYKAVVEGWRPNLVSMEVYPKTTTITQTKLKKPVFSLTLGPGVGWDGKEIKPAIQLTAGFVLFSR